MDWLPPAVIASLSGSVALSTVYLYLYFRYKEKFMGLWSLSWVIYSLRYAVVLLFVLVAKHPVLIFLNQSFALASGLLLFAGTVMFAGKTVHKAYYALGGIGIAWIAYGTATDTNFLWLTLPTFGFLGLVYIWTGMLILKSRMIESAPKKVTAYAFILWGIHKFNFPFLADVEWFAPWGYLIAAGLGLVISLGVLLIYYEQLGEKLLSTKEWYENLFFGAAHGSAVAEADTGIIVSCNRKLADMLGYTIDEIVGQHQSFFHRKDGEEEFSPSFKEHRVSPSGRVIETQMIKKDGTPIDVEIQSIPLERDGVKLLQGFFYDVTEKNKAAETIRISEERYRSIVENTDDLITRTDTKGILLYANPSSRKFWGLPPEDCIGKLAFDFIHPEDRQHTMESFQSWLESDQDYITFENRQLHVSGKATTLLWTITATRNKQDGIIEFTGIARDIEGIRSEERLQAALLELIEYSNTHSVHKLLEQFLKKAENLTSSKIGFYHFVDENSGQLSLQAWSKNTIQNFCKAEGEGLHYPISEAGVWVDAIHRRQPVIHNDYQSLPDKKGFPEGHAQVIREMVIPVFREKNIVAILGVGNKESDYDNRDITVVQRLADLAWEIITRKQAEEALRESEERFQKMFRDHDAVMLLIEPKSGQVIDANNAAVAYYGYPLERFKQISMHEINTLAPGIVTDVHDKVFSGEQTCYEFKHRLASGEIRDVEVHISPIEIRNQRLFFSVNQDITDRKRLMEEQSRSAQLAALGTVAAGVAHEINNPIQGIMNYAELIERNPDRTERNQDIAKRIKDESKRIAKITQDLLFYSKDSRIEMKMVDVKEVISGALTLIATKLRNEGAILELDVEDDLPLMLLQPQSLQQVIINLVDNANDALRAKAQPTAKKIILIKANLVKATKDKSVALCIEVYDNGIGMSEEVLENAQEAFFTTKPPSEGTGLGLSIVNNIVKKHNGQIEIDSRDGEFTRIKIMIPAIEEAN